MVNSASFPEALKKGLDGVFTKAYDSTKYEYPDIYTVDTTEDPYIDYLQYTLPDVVSIVQEGASYTRVDITRVRTVRHYVFTLKAEMKCTKEAVEDLKFGELKNGAKALGNAMRVTVERLHADYISNMFTTTLSPDNKSLFNTAHDLASPLPGKPTQMGNRSQLRLTHENLKTRRIAMRKQLNENGTPINANAKILLTGPDLEFEAEEITRSEKASGTGNNNINVNKRIKPVSLTFLQEGPFPNMWVLIDPDHAMLNSWWRRKPEQHVTDEPGTDDYLYRTSARLAIGASDYRGFDGNTGEI